MLFYIICKLALIVFLSYSIGMALVNSYLYLNKILSEDKEL